MYYREARRELKTVKNHKKNIILGLKLNDAMSGELIEFRI